MSAFSISSFSVSQAEDKLDGDHLVAAFTFVTAKKSIQTYSLIDTGCSGYASIDETFARYHSFSFNILKTPRTLKVIEGRSISLGRVTYGCRLQLSIDSHHETATFFVTKLGSYPVVLGIPWLQRHDPELQFKDNTILFNSNHRKQICNSSVVPPSIKGIAPRNLSKFVNSKATSECEPKSKLRIHSVEIEDNRKTKKLTASGNSKSSLPVQYHKFYGMMDKRLANSLPPRHIYDHKIPIKDGKEPPFGPLHSIFREELTELKSYIQENLKKGFIRTSSSPAGAPILFVRKTN